VGRPSGLGTCVPSGDPTRWQDRRRRGTADGTIGVARYTSAGRLDRTFGSDRLATTSLGRGPIIANATAIQPDGRIIVAGRAANRILLARYQPNGSLDPTFGEGGLVNAKFAAKPDREQAQELVDLLPQLDVDEALLADESFREMLAALDFRATYEPDRSELKLRATVALELLPVSGDGMSSPLSVPPAGIEPATRGLGNRCSIH
jgi:uncharacterized delta-60 repeat protein